ncbi:MAG TPA: FUSC family protein [Acidimicrobiales bacterium]|nr:FUSC family protein [Acidimicrobiales bacterium]
MPDAPDADRGQRGLVTGTIRGVGRIDRSALLVLPGLRVAFGIVAVLSAGLAAGDRGAAASMAAGALLVGVPSLMGGSRPPRLTMAAVTIAMAVSTFVGSVTGHVGWLHIALLAPWSFAGGMLVAVGNPGASVGTQAVIAMIVFGRFSEPAPQALQLAGFVAIGGAVQILLVTMTRWSAGLRVERRALADAYRLLAGLTVPGPAPSSLAAAGALDAAEGLLSSPSLIGRADASALRSLLDLGRRLRLELVVIDETVWRLEQQAGAELRGILDTARRTLTLASFAMNGVAGALEQREPFDTVALDKAVAELAARSTRDLASGAGDPTTGALLAALLDRIAALGGQLRSVASLALRPAGPVRIAADFHRPALEPDAFGDWFRSRAEQLRANLTLRSPACRHAVRLAAVVPLAELLALHSPLQRGYWVPVTATIVLKPDFGATFLRGIARMLGTCLGVLLAGLVGVALHPSEAATVIVLGALAVAACATFQVNYAIFTGFLTGVVVLLISLVTPGTLTTAIDRLVDTVVGGGLALVVYALWPTWSREEARRSLVALAQQQREYLRAVLRALTGEASFDEATLRSLSRQTRLARSSADAAVARSAAEPAARRIDLAESSGVLAGLRRTGIVVHALRTDIRAGRIPAPLPETAPLAAAFDTAAGEIVALVAVPADARHDVPAGAGWPPLRRLHGELADALGGRAACALVLSELDELVDAIDTLAGLLAPPLAAAP